MAEEKPQEDKTEQATPKRIEDARKKGDVPRSRELTMTTVMITGTSGLLLLAGPMGNNVLRGMAGSLSIDRQQIFDVSYMPAALAAKMSHALLGLIPLSLLILIAVFAGATLLGGWSFSASAMAFKAGKMNPIKGIKKIFSANGLNELVKALAKFTLVATAAVSWLWYRAEDLQHLGRQPVDTAITNALQIAGVSFLIVSTSLIFIALVDVPFQLWNYNKKLKMTRQEVRDEHKDLEGRPEVKSRIRTLQQQIASRRMMEDVPTADVVITNPTHFAVAIKYEDGLMRAPRVVALGKDIIATTIRELAEASGVPLFSAPPLARALYHSTRLGQEIPAGLYTVVAQVLAYIYQIRDLARNAVEIQKPNLPFIDESLYS